MILTIKNSFHGLKSNLDTVEKIITELEDIWVNRHYPN